MAAKRRKKNRRPAVQPLAETQLPGTEAPAEAPQPEPPQEERAFSHLFLEQCLNTAAQGAALLPKRQEEPASNAENNLKDCPFLFDIINSRVSNLKGGGESKSMPVYLTEEGQLMRCHPYGVYRGPQVSCYELFCESRQEDIRRQVLSRAIQDTVGERLPASGCRFLCMMPDVVDDFDQVLRRQLEWKGRTLFQVPRSIALAYTLQAQGEEVPPEFLCLEYDDEIFWAVHVCRTGGEDAVFVRMGQENIAGPHLSYRVLAQDYLGRYAKKYKILLTDQTRSSLINTKALQNLLFAESGPILTDCGGQVAAIRRDEEILNTLKQQLWKDIQQIRNSTGLPVYPLSSFFGGAEEGLFTIRQLEQGCLALCSRADRGEILWQEYLPHLELEVNRDGIFDHIELVGEKDRRQNISTFFLNDKVEIPISNGTIWFPANGEEHYDLPLIREAYGRRDRDKLARFQLEEPLNEDTQVELTVHYRYGDIDSYQLIAKAKHQEKTFTSIWCDTQPLDNLAPSYQEQRKQHFLNQTEMERVAKAFQRFGEKVYASQRPVRLRRGSVYFQRKKNYSKYLYELNGPMGWPYFMIQDFFRIESFEDTKPYVAELLDNEVFGCVAGILAGTLPEGHDLGVDEASGQDESRILIQNMAEIACQMGYFYCLSPDSPEAFQAAEDILDYFRKKQSRNLQYWAPITKYVDRAQDPHGIWNSFSEALKQLNSPNLKWVMVGLRSISGVCFQTGNWIFDLFHGPKGRAEVDLLVRRSLDVLNSREWLRQRNGSGSYNPRVLRDILELLLCVCRLKQEDPTILDCNEARTKEFVKWLKEIDQQMRELDEKQLLECSFNSRLGIDTPASYSRVNPVIYALLQTLTGGKPVSLVGFSEDDR